MKIKLYYILIISAFCLTSLRAQDYLISLAGSGASTTVASVKVENLTQGTELTMNGNDILHLKNVITGIESNGEDKYQRISFSPNPMTDYTLIKFELPEDGQTTTSLFDITGRIILQIQDYLDKGQHTYRIQGINNGLYIVKVVSTRYSVSGRLLCSGYQISDPKIIYENIAVTEKKEYDSKGISAETVMQYNTGDRLKLTGISDIYSTVITDVPTESKTITFNFIACTDREGNNYPVVTIGTQTWMAENLKTTKYLNGDLIGTTSPANKSIWGEIAPLYQWAYEGNESNVAIYGRLYTWYAIKDSRNVCPTGWHVPTGVEWNKFENYLIANGYNYDGTTTGNKIAKALASTTLWRSNTDIGTVGNTDYPAKRNATGFTALPGGYRNPIMDFWLMGDHGEWWSSSEYGSDAAVIRAYIYSWSGVGYGNQEKSFGLSVRCIKDN